jgi:hypothetical protein
LACTGKVRPKSAASGRVALQPRRLLLPAFTTLPIDTLTGAVGRRPSGARLYHHGSRFGPPERRKIDRNVRVRILHLAIALDRRTRQRGQHGGVLKRTGIEILRVLLFEFLNITTGECWPSLDMIADRARCCVETVRKAIRALEAAGVIETTRRKIVVSFTSRVHRVRYDIAVQTSNSYVFNIPLPDRPTEGDLAAPLLRPPPEADTKFRDETNSLIKNAINKTPPPDRDVGDLNAVKAYWTTELLGTDIPG